MRSRYAWDPVKARANVLKHGVDFADAVLVLEDSWALTIDDRDHNELRFRTLGADPTGRLLVVVHASGPGGVCRIISARPATPRECAHYIEGLRGPNTLT